MLRSVADQPPSFAFKIVPMNQSTAHLTAIVGCKEY
jgi:hypothetical protein